MSRVFDFIEVSHAGLHRSGASLAYGSGFCSERCSSKLLGTGFGARLREHFGALRSGSCQIRLVRFGSWISLLPLWITWS